MADQHRTPQERALVDYVVSGRFAADVEAQQDAMRVAWAEQQAASVRLGSQFLEGVRADLQRNAASPHYDKYRVPPPPT